MYGWLEHLIIDIGYIRIVFDGLVNGKIGRPKCFDQAALKMSLNDK